MPGFRSSVLERIATAFVVAMSCLVVSAPLASADPPAVSDPLPVRYGNGYAFGTVAINDWNGQVPGADDYACTPSAAHPNPVVLVGSTFLSAAVNWTAVAPYLYNQGYCVYTINYGRKIYNVPPGIIGLDPVASSAREVADLVARVRQATGAARIDMVGHSQGGLVSRYFIEQLGGADVVDKMVLLSSPYKATGLPVDIAAIARNTIPQSVFDAIENNGVVPPVPFNFINPYALGLATDHLTPSVTYTQITDIADEVGLYGGLTPLAGATNASIEYINQACPTDFSQHFAQPYSPTAVAMIGNALGTAEQRQAVPCTFVPLYAL